MCIADEKMLKATALHGGLLVRINPDYPEVQKLTLFLIKMLISGIFKVPREYAEGAISIQDKVSSASLSPISHCLFRTGLGNNTSNR